MTNLLANFLGEITTRFYFWILSADKNQTTKSAYEIGGIS